MALGKKCFQVAASSRAKAHVRCIMVKASAGKSDAGKGKGSSGGGSQKDNTTKAGATSNYDEAVKSAKASVKSNDDAFVITQYTNTAYISWNNCKRRQKMCPPDTSEIDKLDSLLEQAPKYQGETYRGISFSNKSDFENILIQAKKGSVFTDKGFMSTSVKDKVIRDFQTSDFNITFKVNSKRGVAIKEFSSLKYEEEVLFKSNTNFMVKNVKKISNTHVEIDLVDP